MQKPTRPPSSLVGTGRDSGSRRQIATPGTDRGEQQQRHSLWRVHEEEANDADESPGQGGAGTTPDRGIRIPCIRPAAKRSRRSSAVGRKERSARERSAGAAQASQRSLPTAVPAPIVRLSAISPRGRTTTQATIAQRIAIAGTAIPKRRTQAQPTCATRTGRRRVRDRVLQGRCNGNRISENRVLVQHPRDPEAVVVRVLVRCGNGELLKGDRPHRRRTATGSKRRARRSARAAASQPSWRPPDQQHKREHRDDRRGDSDQLEASVRSRAD